jgi:hypothetical protein
MDEIKHTAFRAAALVAASTAAGAIDPGDILANIPAAEAMPAEEAVAAVKAAKPHLFRPKQARDMSDEEYRAALEKHGIRDRAVRRHRI